MYFTEDDNSVYVTRGDTVVLSLTAEMDGADEAYCFKSGDVIRIKVFEKKNCENVALQKDFGIEEATDTVQLTLTGDDTRIGGIISKPVDYWYEIELNPDTEPQTIIGYDDEGPRLFKLMPEGKDVDKTPSITPQDIPVVDDELSLTSKRPVQNKVITGAIAELTENIGINIEKEVNAAASQVHDDISLLKTRVDVLTSVKIPTSAVEQEVADARVEADGTVAENLGEAVRNAYNKLLEIKVDKEEGKDLSSNDFTDSLKQKLNAIEAGATKTVVDTALSATSANPVENRAISDALSQKVEKVSGKSLSTNDFTDSLKQKLNEIETGANKTVVDTALSATSANPVENKAVKSELDKKLSLSGGTMAGNLGMGGKDILNVKKIIFIYENGEWLNMGGHPITNLAAPTADHHAANRAYVDGAIQDIPQPEIDSEISDTSENPVQNKVVYEAVNGKVDKINGKQLSTNDFTDSLKQKLNSIQTGANKTVVDTELSDTSENPIQNKIVTTELGKIPVKTVDFLNCTRVSKSGLYITKKIKCRGAELSSEIYDIFAFVYYKGGIQLGVGYVCDINFWHRGVMYKYDGAKDEFVTAYDTSITESDNAPSGKAVKAYVDSAAENTKPTLITFNNADFDSSDTQQAAAYISFALVEAHILLTATFDISRLNFVIPEGADFSISKVLVENEPFDLSILDNYIKNMDLFSADQGEGWFADGSQYMYMHDYNFETSTNAQTAYEEIQSSINITGFQLLISTYNQITAQEVE